MADSESSAPSFTDQPIFFRSVLSKPHRISVLSVFKKKFLCPRREFRFTSEVPIRLDYHGKHVSMEQVQGPRNCTLFNFCIMNFCVWSVAGDLCWNHYGVDTT